jgi:hypothetical protein
VGLPHAPQHLQAVDLRHHDIQQHQIERLAGEPIEGLQPVLRPSHEIAQASEVARERIAVRLAVVDDQQRATRLAVGRGG